MPSNKLFSLFDEKLRTPHELIAGPTQNLDSIGNNIEDPDTILRKIRQFEIVRPKVDFSDFANFVFFNSAEDYFNITGEKILNEYPYDGTSDQVQQFVDALDDYQRYVVGIWPRSDGHLRFNPASGFAYVQVDDIGKDGDVTKNGLLSPGTGSFSVEFWAIAPPALTGSNDAMIVLQKITGSGEGITVYYSGSSAFMGVVSGTTVDITSAPFVPGTQTYFCFTYDRSGTYPILSAYTGSVEEFPVRVATSTGSILGSVSAGSGRLYMGSGSSGILPISVRPLTGSLDDLRFWKKTRSLTDVSSSFNTKIYAQDGLYGLWRFNESGSLPVSDRAITKDHSGKKLHGRIQNYFSALRGSGSLLPYDADDLILTLDSPEVSSYISEQQASGSLYDKLNDNLITRLMPEQFFLLEEFKNTNVLQNFLFVLGRYFDQIKVSIDQFAHIVRTEYGAFNQTPDALLQDVAKFFGWEFTGNFLDADVVQYIIGKRVLANTQANKALDVKLFEIKNEFWKRTLINLMHMYKTKGTRESVETLLRVYGVNRNFIRLKEYGYKPNAGISTFRINAQKSVNVLEVDGSQRVWNNALDASFETVELRVKFPTETSSYLTASVLTGSIFEFGDNAGVTGQLFFTKQAANSTTGSLIFTGSEGNVTLADLPIFDNEWYNLVVTRDAAHDRIQLDVRSIDQDEIDFYTTASLTIPLTITPGFGFMQVGMSRDTLTGSQMWAQECRVWNQVLDVVEMDDHALNFQSYGTQEVQGEEDLHLHWRLNDDQTVDGTGFLVDFAYNFSEWANSGVSLVGRAQGFDAFETPFRKFLFDYNYIASPEFGWNEEKIRNLDSSTVKPSEAFVDNPLVALEFNLVDALNEDISQIIATMDGFNESIGAPVNRFRDSYPDLDILRFNYFKRLQGSINFRVFADLLEFFDRSFVDMIRRLIPARAIFLGDEFVVESHMLERPKMQWNYRRKDPEFQPEGVIKVYIRS